MKVLRTRRKLSERCQMVGLTTASDSFRFEIPSEDLKGPLNLAETILSGQTSKPEWLRNGESFTGVEIVDGVPVKYMVNQIGDPGNYALHVVAIPSNTSGACATSLREVLQRGFGLEDDLNLFYRKFAEEDKVLSLTFKNLRGLRLMRAANLFESLICSILSQNNSVRLWNRSARLMMKHYGREAFFMDGSREFLFPTPEALSRLNPRSLRSATSLGYRAKPVVEVSRMLVRGELDLETLVR